MLSALFGPVPSSQTRVSMSFFGAATWDRQGASPHFSRGPRYIATEPRPRPETTTPTPTPRHSHLFLEGICFAPFSLGSSPFLSLVLVPPKCLGPGGSDHPPSPLGSQDTAGTCPAVPGSQWRRALLAGLQLSILLVAKRELLWFAPYPAVLTTPRQPSQRLGNQLPVGRRLWTREIGAPPPQKPKEAALWVAPQRGPVGSRRKLSCALLRHEGQEFSFLPSLHLGLGTRREEGLRASAFAH